MLLTSLLPLEKFVCWFVDFCLAFLAILFFAVFAFDETYTYSPKTKEGTTGLFGQFLGSKILNSSTHKTQQNQKNNVVKYVTFHENLRVFFK